ncbi:G5 domain-containing protein [Aerococcus sanguinicola]|uniref:G5 domain-containing protein n=1 Tax=Aerococcus sanguinicola TaxID=119206 RepID=UPI0018A6FABB|nr:G5 domain-containing protein [Aerococcus sanguinicola]
MKKSFLPLATTSLILTAFLAQGEQVQAEEQPAAEYAASDKLVESSPAADLARPSEVKPAPTRPESAPSEEASSSSADDRHQAYRKEQDQKVIEDYEKLVETPVEVVISNTNESIKMPPQDENEDVIYKQTYTGKAVIPKGESIPTLDLDTNLDEPIILQSFVNLDQEKAKIDGLAAIKELRSIVWDMEGNSELIGEQVNPKTGERVEGVWINGKRLRDRLKAEGISTKEEYVNRLSWNSDLENLALLNLGEAKDAYFSLRDYEELSKTTNANESYCDRVVLNEINSSLTLKENIVKQFGLDVITQHSYNQGIEESNISKFLNLVLNPRNRSFALAVDYQPWESDRPKSFSLISSDKYQEKDASKNYKGEFIILFNQNFKEHSQYQSIDFPPIFEGSQYELPIFVNSYGASRRLVHSFEGNRYSLNSEIVKFNEDGSITALKPGKTILFINIDGILKSMTVEVVPSPIVEDKITVWDGKYVYPIYIKNPDMYVGEERVIEEGRPSLRYYLTRDILSVDGKFLNREFLKDWEIPGIDQVIEYGTKKRPDKKAAPRDVITGHLYESIPGYFEILPGYHIRLVPETEDQVLRINEQNFKTVIQPRDDLALGEHVIIQDGVNRYTEVTNRIYKGHQNNILKTQEISRQDFPGQDLIIGVGTGKGGAELPGEEGPVEKAPASRVPEETVSETKVTPVKETGEKAPNLSPGHAAKQEGTEMPHVEEDRPTPSRNGQAEEEGFDQVTTGAVSTEASVEGPVVAAAQDEVGPDLVSAVAVSIDSGQMSQGIDEVSASEALASQDEKSMDHSEAQGSRAGASEESDSAKDQAKGKIAQVTASSQSQVRSSSDPFVHSPSVSTQLPKTGARSLQPALSLGLSSLALGLCLSLRAGKKGRKE